MSSNLSTKPAEHHVAEVVHHGDQLMIPENMDIPQAIKLLEDRQDYMNMVTSISRDYEVFPWDGANALAEVIAETFGWVQSVATPDFFGENPPKMINIEVAPGTTKAIPWGRMQLQGIDGFLETSVCLKEGRMCFQIASTVRRASEALVQSIFDKVGVYLANKSIYRGQAVRIRFRDDDGKPLTLPEPKFIDTTTIDQDMLTYSDSVERSVATNLFTPIERIKDCIANDIPVKRGVLLGGPYGTGKTLAASVAAAKAVENEVTYLYVPRADELGDALHFARMYNKNGCVIFCEDIDRAVNGERSVEMDDILNILDGIETKGSNIITVLTTNHLENINPAMLRPGRLDAVINVTPPNAEAAERLLRKCGNGAIKPETDLSKVAVHLDGMIPAVIAEVVQRAKLTQLRLQPAGTKVVDLSEEALLESAETMKAQIALLAPRTEVESPEIETSLLRLMRKASGEDNGRLDEIESSLENIKTSVNMMAGR